MDDLRASLHRVADLIAEADIHLSVDAAARARAAALAG